MKSVSLSLIYFQVILENLSRLFVNSLQLFLIMEKPVRELNFWIVSGAQVNHLIIPGNSGGLTKALSSVVGILLSGVVISK